MSRLRFQSPYEQTPNPDFKESVEHWTQRLALTGMQIGIFRQCSIGWHEECSDPYGDTCRCMCHTSLTEDA